MNGRIKFRTGLCPTIVAAGVVLAAVTAAPSASAEVIALSPLAPTTPGLVHRWAALNQVPPTGVTSAQAAAVANNFDLVIVKSSQQSLVSAMKAANPRLTTLVYHNGAFAQSNEGTKFPASWYAMTRKAARSPKPSSVTT